MANPLSEEFNDSLERCLAVPGFLQRFYELFLESSPEVREKFRATDLVRQTRMLRISLYMVLEAGYGAPEATAHLERIGRLHSKHERDIPPHLYQLWLASLLAAVKEHDPRYAPATDSAWREMLAPGIASLIAAYDAPK